ncbi:hypothetical protein EYF80_051245 [Liparis tanakae]|uniref:Uncharacterized protein n=1 Tax=Liparis tanakae TaxID=230148 RepID=A0A4Z2FDV8_9TELE|nr:hypothetical protein EYF80_051245 [Liparis tanakae]
MPSVHQLVLDELPEDLVAAAVLEAGDGGQEAHGDDLMVLHPHLHLRQATTTDTQPLSRADRRSRLTAVRTRKSSRDKYLNTTTFSFPMFQPEDDRKAVRPRAASPSVSQSLQVL